MIDAEVPVPMEEPRGGRGSNLNSFEIDSVPLP